MRSRIMYVERKEESLNGPARIGRVSFSKSGATLRYRGQEFQRFRGSKANYYDIETGDEYWISGPRKDGADRLYPQSRLPIEIDEDIRDEYWRDIRGMEPPE